MLLAASSLPWLVCGPLVMAEEDSPLTLRAVFCLVSARQVGHGMEWGDLDLLDCDSTKTTDGVRVFICSDESLSICVREHVEPRVGCSGLWFMAVCCKR